MHDGTAPPPPEHISSSSLPLPGPGPGHHSSSSPMERRHSTNDNPGGAGGLGHLSHTHSPTTMGPTRERIYLPPMRGSGSSGGVDSPPRSYARGGGGGLGSGGDRAPGGTGQNYFFNFSGHQNPLASAPPSLDISGTSSGLRSSIPMSPTTNNGYPSNGGGGGSPTRLFGRSGNDVLLPPPMSGLGSGSMVAPLLGPGSGPSALPLTKRNPLSIGSIISDDSRGS